MAMRWRRPAAALLAALCLALPQSGCACGRLSAAAAVQTQATDSVTVLCVADPRGTVLFLAEAAGMVMNAVWPEVEVRLDYVTDTDAGAMARLRTRLMAGEGPDVLLDYTDGALLEGLYKRIPAGFLCDMAPYYEQTGFDPADYCAAALASGQYRDGQYLMPVCMDFDMAVSTDGALSAAGLSAEDLADPRRFVAAQLAAAQGGPLWRDPGWYQFAHGFKRGGPGDTTGTQQDRPWDDGGQLARDGPERRFLESRFHLLMSLYPSCVDYTAQQARFGVDGLQDFFALCRAQYPDAQAHLADSSPLPAFLDGETALLRCNSQDFSNYCATLNAELQWPVAVMPQNDAGGVTAHVAVAAGIAGGSQNKVNAWRFISSLMANIPQQGVGRNYRDYTPVRLADQEDSYRQQAMRTGFDARDVLVEYLAMRPGDEAWEKRGTYESWLRRFFTDTGQPQWWARVQAGEFDLTPQQWGSLEQSDPLVRDFRLREEVQKNMPRELKQAVSVKPAVQALTRAAQSIDRAILDPEAYSLLFGAMVPYIQGRADYGTCRQKAQRDVDFYFDE